MRTPTAMTLCHRRFQALCGTVIAMICGYRLISMICGYRLIAMICGYRLIGTISERR
ncbi:MAG: hypothetical protein ACM4D3_22495 [Candidatus Sericytochromatia bacterium]